MFIQDSIGRGRHWRLGDCDDHGKVHVDCTCLRHHYSRPRREDLGEFLGGMREPIGKVLAACGEEGAVNLVVEEHLELERSARQCAFKLDPLAQYLGGRLAIDEDHGVLVAHLSARSDSWRRGHACHGGERGRGEVQRGSRDLFRFSQTKHDTRSFF